MMRRQRHIRLLSALVAAVLLLAVMGGGPALAQGTPSAPVLPESFWGSVKDASGNPILTGTVEAWMNGVKQDSIAIVNGQYGGPGFDDKLVVGKTGGESGDIVEFYVNGVKAKETATYDPTKGVVKLDLTVSGTSQPPQDTTPPAVAATDPVDGATGVAVSKTISVTFDEDVQAGNAYNGISVKDASGNTVAVAKSIAGKVLSLKPNASLAYNTKYTVTIPAGAVKDLAGNALVQDYTFSFTTQAASSGGGGGGGGGGGAPAPSTDKLEKPVQAGASTVAEISGKAKVELPAGAVTGTNATLKVEVLSDDKASGAGMPLLSKVVNVTLKNGTLSGKAIVTLYYDKSKLTSDQVPVAYCYDEQSGKWVRLEGTVDAAGGTVTAHADQLAMFAVFAETKQQAPPAPTTSFKDMQGHWAAEAVGRLAEAGIISGYPDGTFGPDRQITRAEVTAIMVKLLGLEPGKESELKFKDNAAIPAWAKGAVAAAVKEGIIKGYPHPDGSLTFGAGRQLSRAEMAAMAAGVLEKKLGSIAPAELKFTDAAAIPSWAKNSVATVVAKGIVSGYPDGTFKAANKITRAETAVIVLRLLEVLGE